jgi:hypothetical protein
MTVIKKLAEGLDPTGPDLMVYLNLSVGPLEYVMDVIEPTDPDLWKKITHTVERWTEYWTDQDFNSCVWYIVFV